MILSNIFQVMDNEQLGESYTEIWEGLKKKYGKGEPTDIYKDDLLETWRCKPSYSRCTYEGVIKEGVTLSELELSMILDSGFSHFGGSSTIYSDRSFKVVIHGLGGDRGAYKA